MMASRISVTLMWLRGHVHDGHDYVADGGSTRIVCNPRGYSLGTGRVENDPALVIELPEWTPRPRF
jgi:hypothetical protein